MIGAGTLHQGCFGGGDGPMKCDGAPGINEDLDFRSCPVPEKPRALHGTDGEGRVEITAREAWPDRAEEPPHLTAEEVATGCAAFIACDDNDTSALLGQDVFLSNCFNGATFLSTKREQRAIPFPGSNERFPFLIRQVLESSGDCTAIRSILTAAPRWFYCEEDGCIAKAAQEVTCEGDVAVFKGGSRRDCSRAYATCSTSSETGCTDRPFTRCESGAKDRCDGDVKLGCDGCGFVSYRDCGWNGGHCEESETGAACVDPDLSGCTGMQDGCTDGAFETCVFGKKVRVDCAALGLECASTHYPAAPPDPAMPGICELRGFSGPCDLAFCQQRSEHSDAGAPQDAGATDAAL
jgi:hypothetical protein